MTCSTGPAAYPKTRSSQVLVGEAYELLDPPARQVMQALAVYPAPVSTVGVDFLLRPVNPTIDAAPILTRLVRRQLARFQQGNYYLHPVDREYARSQLPVGSSDDSPAAITLAGLQARAADWLSGTKDDAEGSDNGPLSPSFCREFSETEASSSGTHCINA